MPDPYKHPMETAPYTRVTTERRGRACPTRVNNSKSAKGAARTLIRTRIRSRRDPFCALKIDDRGE